MSPEEKRRKLADYMRAYTAANADKINAQRRARRSADTLARERKWNQENRAKRLTYKKTDREKRPADYRRWKREWEARNADRVAARKRSDYATNKLKIAERLEAFRKNNPTRYKERQERLAAKRRARLANVAHEPIDRRAVYERDAHKCGICGRKVAWRQFSLDHILPVSRGGPHTYANVRTAHINCNKRRGNRGDVQPKLAI